MCRNNALREKFSSDIDIYCIPVCAHVKSSSGMQNFQNYDQLSQWHNKIMIQAIKHLIPSNQLRTQIDFQTLWADLGGVPLHSFF